MMKTKTVEMCNYDGCEKYCEVRRCIVCNEMCCKQHSYTLEIKIKEHSYNGHHDASDYRVCYKCSPICRVRFIDDLISGMNSERRVWELVESEINLIKNTYRKNKKIIKAIEHLKKNIDWDR